MLTNSYGQWGETTTASDFDLARVKLQAMEERLAAELVEGLSRRCADAVMRAVQGGLPRAQIIEALDAALTDPLDASEAAAWARATIA
ncbi:hypothetical protein GCM10028796_21500 [Ramlibacter monticola]|uniref:Uncharacterized protein n=1 Tax=Ramlibacter monticola TaxID=1926872 RepID=A0A937CTK7_9BURK|nr:hypothetical protein [Ramlibacter monticola]MBL0392401.1 hypothetical protein [Ramlibacter monticola]